VLQDGTVLTFDDWNCNRANPAFGQRRAFREFLETHPAKYSASHYLNYGFNCAAFILHLNA
jgi:O-methyltransferase